LSAGERFRQRLPRSQFRPAIEIPHGGLGALIFWQLEEPLESETAQPLLVLLRIAGVVGGPPHDVLAFHQLRQRLAHVALLDVVWLPSGPPGESRPLRRRRSNIRADSRPGNNRFVAGAAAAIVAATGAMAQPGRGAG